MPIAIGSSYGSYYTQANTSCSNTNKTSASNISIAEPAISKEEYFQNLCSKYPNVNINMSDSYLYIKNEITYNVSPKLINKAINDPETAKKLNDMLDQAPVTAQFISAFKYIGNREVTSVSIYIDKNGGCSCQVELKPQKSKNVKKKRDEEKWLERKMKKQKEEAEALARALERKLEAIIQQKATHFNRRNISLVNINV